MSIYQKLIKIQQEVDSFTKDKSGFNYNYTTGNQVLNKIRPMMNKLGLLLKQEVISVENERIDYTNSKGYDKSEILSSVSQRFTWIDVETGDMDVNLWHGNGMNDWDKGLGSALTYGERYFLLKYFHVPTDEDDNDNRQNNTGAYKKKSADDDKPWLGEEMKKEWMNAEDAVRDGKIQPRDLRKYYKVSKANMAHFERIKDEVSNRS